ncbi:hypothetical protein [Lysinibacillus sp. TE18511]
MENQSKSNRLAAISLIMTVVLVVAALLVLFSGIPNSDLRISIFLFLMIDIGFIVAMILGIKTKQTGIRVFSVISNGIFIVFVFFFMFAIAFFYGFSAP